MSEFKTALQPAAVTCPSPLPSTQAHECEFTLNIGIFMDGTDNNKATDKIPSVNTNVVRLWQAYRDEPQEGFFRYYVSGVGQPFTEIHELKAPSGGGSAGDGGEARIVYALLQVINAVHSFVNQDTVRFKDKQIDVLCTDTRVPSGTLDLTGPQRLLKDMGQSCGLIGDAGERERFIRREAGKLAQQVQARTTHPKVVSIYLDVFGFSRGAAQARVFTTWLHRLMLIDKKLFGAESYVRMLGLFDTVSSVGLTEAVGRHGHSNWALAEDLPIPAAVKNCVHYVALHELRTNFPSDSVAFGALGSVPSNCFEHFYPGVHSDVGGSYAAGNQGKGVREEPLDPRYSIASGGGKKTIEDESRKLSQLALNDMFDAARKTCANHESKPWIDLSSQASKDLKLPDRFAMASDRSGNSLVRAAVTQYFTQSKVPPEGNVIEALRAHGLRYLAWRYQVDKKKGFEALPSIQSAKQTDPDGLEYLREGQKIFSQQVMLLAHAESAGNTNAAMGGFNSHAGEIFASMKKQALDDGIGPFFDEWIHDSYAGFIGKFKDVGPNWAKLGGVVHVVAEAQRYVRWRGLYCGGNVELNALLSKDMDSRTESSAYA